MVVEARRLASNLMVGGVSIVCSHLDTTIQSPKCINFHVRFTFLQMEDFTAINFLQPFFIRSFQKHSRCSSKQPSSRPLFSSLGRLPRVELFPSTPAERFYGDLTTCRSAYIPIEGYVQISMEQRPRSGDTIVRSNLVGFLNKINIGLEISGFEKKKDADDDDEIQRGGISWI